MKLLFVNPSGGTYGSERSMLSLLKAGDFEAEVVCPDGGALAAELGSMGVRVHPLEFGKYSLRQNPFWHLQFFFHILYVLRRRQPDRVVINLDGNTPLITIAAALAGIPIVRFCRFEFEAPVRWVDRWCWLKPMAIICPSDTVKLQLLAWAPPNMLPRIHRLYDSYTGHTSSMGEVEKFKNSKKIPDGKWIGCIGRLHRGKRIEVAIKAFARVLQSHSDARLLVIGSADSSTDGSAYQKELEMLASELGIANNVHFLGYLRPEIMPVAIASLDLSVLPSESESFGMVLIESWAQGVPTVTSDVSGCAEITRASSGGSLVPVGDDIAMAHQINRYLSDSSVSELAGERGLEWITKHCNYSAYSKSFISIIQ
jgi:glycosyltransferase involved in cell wall biosynthesis